MCLLFGIPSYIDSASPDGETESITTSEGGGHIAKIFQALILISVMVVIIGLFCIPTVYYAIDDLDSRQTEVQQNTK